MDGAEGETMRAIIKRIRLDRVRHLRFFPDAFERSAKVLGISIEQVRALSPAKLSEDPVDLRFLAAILWPFLTWEDPELTPARVEVSLGELSAIRLFLLRTALASFLKRAIHDVDLRNQALMERVGRFEKEIQDLTSF